jgi:hypothetical protein
MARPSTYFDTLPPEAISDELTPLVQELGLTENCRQLAMEGWTVVENAADEQFNNQLREQILQDAKEGGARMLLARDPVYAQAVLNPKLMALAEFSVGRGHLISQVAASVRRKDEPMLGLHADHNWLPAPFPEHNMLLTACWACDEYTKENGATQVIPGSANLRRHPDADEVEAMAGAVPIECSAGSIAVWDGNIWHSSGERTAEGERVVCHITYTRLMMRQVEDYREHDERLIEEHGAPMAGLLGHNDGLFSNNGFDYSKIVETFNNAKR